MYTWGYIKENTLSKLGLSEEEANQQDFLSRFPYYANEAMTQICSAIKPREKFITVRVDETNIGSIIEMPDDFVSFSDTPIYDELSHEVSYEGIIFCDYNAIACHKIGIYRIPYNARWFFFTKTDTDTTVIKAPADVCDALPSYIAAQCLKGDDELKASIYRNEYEMFLARMDDSSIRSQKTFYVGGGW